MLVLFLFFPIFPPLWLPWLVSNAYLQTLPLFTVFDRLSLLHLYILLTLSRSLFFFFASCVWVLGFYLFPVCPSRPTVFSSSALLLPIALGPWVSAIKDWTRMWPRVRSKCWSFSLYIEFVLKACLMKYYSAWNFLLDPANCSPKLLAHYLCKVFTKLISCVVIAIFLFMGLY